MDRKGCGSRAFLLVVSLALGLGMAGLALRQASAAFRPNAAKTFCVNGTGTGCDGSLDGCFAVIQDAIDAAAPGDQLRVAGGTYKEPGGTVISIHGKGLGIDGGYDSTCSQQDPDVYKTVLDGQGAGSVVSVTNTSGDVFLRWLTIQNGNGSGNCGIGGCGGGVYVLSSNFRLGHSIVQYNTGGSAPSVVGDGGGIFVQNYYEPNHFVHIFDTKVLSNTCSDIPNPGAQAGGGLYLYEGEIQLNDNLIQGNQCIGKGDAGGAYLYDFAFANLQNNQFLNNEAQRAGGGLVTIGGELMLAHNGFLNNHAGSSTNSGSAVGVWLNNTHGTVDGNTFLMNTGGQAVDIQSSTGLTVTNNLIAANDGSVTITGVNSPGPNMLANNTIADNGSSGVVLWFTATAKLVNNIIAGHSMGIYMDSTSQYTSSHNIFWNSYESFTSTVDIFEDPRLDPFYHLKPGSPAIDAGLALPWLNVDLEQMPRPLGAGYDIGAFEWDPAAVPPGLFLPLVVRSAP